MNSTNSLLAAFLVGLLGGVHCVGMCGGIVGTLTLWVRRNPRSNLSAEFPYQLAYNAGRIAGYALAGALMGAAGALIIESIPFQYAQRALYCLTGAFMLLLGLYLGGWWHGLAAVERLGDKLWRRIEPFGRRLLPVRSPIQAAGLGLIWAWIPCGLVYSALVWAVTAGSALQGALLMLAFGLGTLPNLLAMGMLAGAAAHLLERTWFRKLAGLVVAGFGIVALYQLIQ